MLVSATEEKVKKIKERNQNIKKGLYSVLEGNAYVFADVYVIGKSHKEASEKLSDFLEKSRSTETTLKAEKEIEEMFNVEIQHSTEIDLDRILAN